MPSKHCRSEKILSCVYMSFGSGIVKMLYSLGLIFILFDKWSTAQVPCPVPWWYCLNRDPNDNSQVYVVDTSNRSAKWNWNAGDGRWDVSYHHSFPNGDYGIYACYTRTADNIQSYVAYEKNRPWRSNRVPINAAGWDMSYNGDIFGFKPQANGQYIFHIYSRKLQHNPFVGNPNENTSPTKKPCSINVDDTLQGSSWILERKSRSKCPVSVNRQDLGSPYEWFWDTDNGKWLITYNWNDFNGLTNSTVYYSKYGSSEQKMKVLNWQFDPNALTVSYAAVPLKIYDEAAWKLRLIGKEAWGFSPLSDGQWIFPIFSRNVIIRPFEKASGYFNLQQEYYIKT